MKGKRPVPTALKVLHGNPGLRPLPKGEIIPPGELAEDGPPDWFTSEQKNAWTYAMQNAPAGLLRRIDRDLLAAWIVSADTHRRASEAMAEGTLLVRGQGAALRANIPNPYIGIVRREALLMTRLAAELGFSPTARARYYAMAAIPRGLAIGPDGEVQNPMALDDYLAARPKLPKAG